MTATSQSDRSLAPGIIPGPSFAHDDAAALTVATRQGGDRKRGRRNLLRVAAAAGVSTLRGDKYMVDAYPAAWPADAPPDSTSSLVSER